MGVEQPPLPRVDACVTHGGLFFCCCCCCCCCCCHSNVKNFTTAALCRMCPLKSILLLIHVPEQRPLPEELNSQVDSDDHHRILLLLFPLASSPLPLSLPHSPTFSFPYRGGVVSLEENQARSSNRRRSSVYPSTAAGTSKVQIPPFFFLLQLLSLFEKMLTLLPFFLLPWCLGLVFLAESVCRNRFRVRARIFRFRFGRVAAAQHSLPRALHTYSRQ